MASLAGFEPATRCLEGSRSVQLSYRDASCMGLFISVAMRVRLVKDCFVTSRTGIDCCWSRS